MGKQHETMPNEPQEAPVHQPEPVVQQPHDPNGLSLPHEAPQNEPQEVPPHPDQNGSELNQTEV